VNDTGHSHLHHLSFACDTNSTHASQAFCESHHLPPHHCDTLRLYAANKWEQACHPGALDAPCLPVSPQPPAMTAVLDEVFRDFPDGGWPQRGGVMVPVWNASEGVVEGMVQLAIGEAGAVDG
jgi:hypothetical protein